jgi:hypothetical protein
MSTITLTSHMTAKVAPELSKTKKISSMSESHSYHVIIGLTVLSFAAVLLLGIVAPIIFSYYGGTTGLGIDTDGECTGRIHSYLRSGYYVSQEQFKAAMAYC